MPEVNIIVKAKDEASSVLSGIGGGLKTLGGAFLGLGAVAGVALVGIGAGLTKLVLDQAKMGPVEKAFGNLALSIGTTADALLNKLKPATLGMLSNDELIISAQKLLTSGLAETDVEVAKIAETATKLGLAVGKDAAGSIEQFANMLLTGGMRALKEFGISTEEVEERVAALKEANADLTDQQAFQQAVMEVGAETIARTGDLSETAAVKMAALGARVENLKDGVAEALQPVLEVFLSSVLEPLVAKIEQWAPLITPVIEQFSLLAQEILNPEGDWVSYLKNEVWEALDNAFGEDAANKIVEFVLNFAEQAGEFKEYLETELLPQLEEWWITINEDVIPAVAELAGQLGEWASSEGVVSFFNALKFIVDTLGKIMELIDATMEKIHALDKWTAENLAPPEARGYPGRAATGTSAAETYLEQSPGGRWEQRVNINVYGIPGLEEALRTVEQHTLGGLR